MNISLLSIAAIAGVVAAQEVVVDVKTAVDASTGARVRALEGYGGGYSYGGGDKPAAKPPADKPPAAKPPTDAWGSPDEPPAPAWGSAGKSSKGGSSGWGSGSGSWSSSGKSGKSGNSGYAGDVSEHSVFIC